jgi:hypothetical protein
MWHLDTSMWYDNTIQTLQWVLPKDLMYVYALNEYRIFPFLGTVTGVSLAYYVTCIRHLLAFKTVLHR